MATIDKLIALIEQYRKLGIDSQIDYEKFYLYSIITHSTAIEGSTVTEIENQLLFDEGISAKGRTIVEQMMNLDLKKAYEESIRLAKSHSEITIYVLKGLSHLIMKNTGSIYKSPLGEFSSANGDIRLVNVAAGVGGKSYMSFQKVPARLQEFCDWLNAQRNREMSIAERYNLSFEAHYRLVTIHPWADGNGRMARLLMNHIQFEFGLVPAKVLKEDKGDYINALIATRENEDITYFLEFMAGEMVKTISSDINAFTNSSGDSGEKKQKSREKILLLLKTHPQYSAKKLADAIGITEKGVEKQLAKLKAEGLLKRTGPDKGGEWIVLE
ncbi:MAG: Fic family protein [Bacteroidales bacterium]|nr:Fic family protein [Bacteroidales bacterium]MBR6882239.1 Fic family protein [Bacteroidales bacterium]